MEDLEKSTNKHYCSIIENITNIIVEHILTEIHPHVIIFKGSFGRDEISVKIMDNKCHILSDCEVIVIPNSSIARSLLFDSKKMRDLSYVLTQKLNLKVEITDLEPELKFLINHNMHQKILPTIDNYELKYGSKQVYGSNFLEKMPRFKERDIPIWEGIRLILNRMTEATYHFSFYYQEGGLPKNKVDELFYWTNKIVLSCQDALLILAGKYHYSYRIRNRRFIKIFPRYFPEVYTETPELLNLTIKATSYKLNPERKIYVKDVIKFWFEVTRIVDIVFRYIIKKDMNISFNSYVEFQEKYLRHPNIYKKYYRGISPNPIYQNFRSMIKKFTLAHKLPNVSLLKYLNIPWGHIIYSTIPLVYFAISQENLINPQYLSRSEKVIRLFGRRLPPTRDMYQKWYTIKNILYEEWRNICY